MTDLTSYSIVVAARRIAEEVTATVSDGVDSKSRFPSESFDALGEERRLATPIPAQLGGLGRQCASTAVVFGMHQIQVDGLVRPARNPRRLLRTRSRDDFDGCSASASTPTLTHCCPTSI
jgi:hypothetical protein